MVPSLSKKKQGIKETSPSPSLKRFGHGSTQGNRSKVSRCSSRVGDSSKGGACKAKRHAKNSVDEEVSEGSDGTSAKRCLRRSPHVAKKAKKQPNNLRKRKRNDSADEDLDTSKESRVGDSSKGGTRKAKRHAKNSVDEEVSEGSDGTLAKRRLRHSPHVAKKARKQPDNLCKCKRNDSADKDSDTSKEYSEYSSELDCPSSNSSASSSSTNSQLQQSGIYVRYAQKIANELKRLDAKMKKLKYQSVERHTILQRATPS
jgi:hypothetical protein